MRFSRCWCTHSEPEIYDVVSAVQANRGPAAHMAQTGIQRAGQLASRERDEMKSEQMLDLLEETQARVRELTAENERLRAQLAIVRDEGDEAREERNAAEALSARIDAFLASAQPAAPWTLSTDEYDRVTWNQPAAPEDDSPEPCMSPFRENYDPNQPAAPDNPARCRDCGGTLTVIPDGFGEAYNCPRCDKPKPAAPTRTEALDWTDKRCDHWLKATRTEACVECAKAGQAVLDAAIKAFRTGLRGPAYTLAEGEFEDALTAYETARRGLK